MVIFVHLYPPPPIGFCEETKTTSNELTRGVGAGEVQKSIRAKERLPNN